MRTMWVATVAAVFIFSACGDSVSGSLDAVSDSAAEVSVDDDEAREAILAMEPSETWTVPGLSAPVRVLRVEMGIPHIYAETESDLAHALGFTVARDRFMIMDLQRRLATGTLSELLGDVGLDGDMESRYMGLSHTTDVILESLSPEAIVFIDGFVGGVNAYINEVKAGRLAAPSEMEIFAPIIGFASPAEMLAPFDRRAVAGMTAVIMYETNFETGDPSRHAKAEELDTLFEGAPEALLRRAGARDDIWNWVKPPFDVASAQGWGLQVGDALAIGANQVPPAAMPNTAQRRVSEPDALNRAIAHLENSERRFMRDKVEGFGSNAWAVSGKHTTTGAALVAGDGHLPLYMPSLMYQIGMNTQLLGQGVTHQAGLLMTSLPILAVGTNGHIAWSQVNPVTDNTDWYREEIKLDTSGAPSHSFYQGEWHELVAVDETYVIADVPALGSVGRDETWTRYITFDGRWIYSLEGRVVASEDELLDGESVVNVMGDLVVPGDMDADGVITAVSYDWAGFDARGYVEALRRMGYAKNVEELRDLHRGQVGGGLFTAAADSTGSILFSGYLAVPCRSLFARDSNGAFLPGSDPTMLLDGTTLGGFEIPTGPDGLVDESLSEPGTSRCVVPMSETPQSIDPPQGYVVTANNQPGPITDDNDLFNEPWYIGGPWSSFRADSIATGLAQAVADQSASVAKMAEIQAHRASRTAERLLDLLLVSIDRAEALNDTDAPLEPWEARLQAIFNAQAGLIEEARSRLVAWREAGFDTPSGVETFYEIPVTADGPNAVATMIFNAWLPRVLQGTFGDEPMSAAFRYNSARTRLRAMERFLRSRGENSESVASFNEATGESVFFDILDTPDVERSDEIVLTGLVDALVALSSAPTDGGKKGGFGTDNMAAWLWGLRHQVRFQSLLSDFIGESPAFAFLADSFSLMTDSMPLAEGMASGDPRKKLVWFPRGGDNYSVDAANPGFSGTDFTHGSGPAMRMVIALKDGKVWGQNIVPGGQSALLESPHHHDQTPLWLANQTVPFRFHAKDVVEGTVSMELLNPAP